MDEMILNIDPEKLGDEFWSEMEDAQTEFRIDREYGWNKPPGEHAEEVLNDYPQLERLAGAKTVMDRVWLASQIILGSGYDFENP